jgi:glycosyltransferase involved in cell wall biosynthesis
MKRTIDQIKAFEFAKEGIEDLKLKIAGDATGEYGKTVLQLIKQSKYKKDIEYLGKVTQNKKKVLMKKCHAILVTSIKEGWGLIVTEAASQGTPAIVYNADGLRDSVIDNKTGLISQNNPQDMARKIVQLFKNKKTYSKLQKNGLEWSEKLTFEISYKVFKKII